MLFFGEEALADGFRLIGFETYPDPAPELVDKRLRELQRDRARAFVIVDDNLMQADIAALHQARREGGRIVVIAVPRLCADPQLHSEVAERLSAMFGGSALHG
ncbi:ATPase [Rhabdochromatium marinum]|nr:ATPase [Rhabdochromatium marinum]MBK1647927.1 ATPase [Rhabdochromatium marinum]